MLRILPVEVRRGPLRSRAGSGGPARLTAIKSWQMRSGEKEEESRRKREEEEGRQPSPGRWGTSAHSKSLCHLCNPALQNKTSQPTPHIMQIVLQHVL